MSKEEILKPFIKETGGAGLQELLLYVTPEDAGKAMEEYAQQKVAAVNGRVSELLKQVKALPGYADNWNLCSAVEHLEYSLKNKPMNKSQQTAPFYCANRPRNCSSQCASCYSDNPYEHPRNYPAIFSPCHQLPHSTDKQLIQSWFIISKGDDYWAGSDWTDRPFLAKRYGSRNAAMEGIVKIGMGGLYKIEEIIALGNNSINKTINHEGNSGNNRTQAV